MEHKKKILLFNLAVDEDDPILAFSVTLIARLAREAELVHVITVRAGRFRLPSNVTVCSVGRESDRGRIASIFSFYGHLLHAIKKERFDICFAHMNPLFVALAGPVCFIQRIRIVLWYAHRHQGIIARIAHFFSWRVLTTNRGGYSLFSDKVVATGHMIDTDFFKPVIGLKKSASPLFVSVGRVAPIKDLMTFIRAAGILRDNGHQFRCVCVGPVLPHDEVYYSALQAEVARLSLSEYFSFAGSVMRENLPFEYGRATAHVNLCPYGALDKAVLEAMACGVPSFFANDEFVSVAGRFSSGLFFKYGDPRDLARLLEKFLLSLAQDNLVRNELRAMVVRRHSLNSFAHTFMELIT